jgi:TonB family protein
MAATFLASPLQSAAAPATDANNTKTGATCRVGRVEAAPIRTVEPNIPAAAIGMGATSGTVKVRVDLSESGKLKGSSVLASSGNFFLDRAAIEAVREMAFSPEQDNCVATGGSYAVEVVF